VVVVVATFVNPPMFVYVVVRRYLSSLGSLIESAWWSSVRRYWVGFASGRRWVGFADVGLDSLALVFVGGIHRRWAGFAPVGHSSLGRIRQHWSSLGWICRRWSSLGWICLRWSCSRCPTHVGPLSLGGIRSGWSSLAGFVAIGVEPLALVVVGLDSPALVLQPSWFPMPSPPRVPILRRLVSPSFTSSYPLPHPPCFLFFRPLVSSSFTPTSIWKGEGRLGLHPRL